MTEGRLDVADNGTLVFLERDSASSPLRTMVWVDRQDGRETPLGADVRTFMHPRLAPDHQRVAVLRAGEGRIWIWDVRRSQMIPGTLDPANISIWLDRTRLVFSGFPPGGGRPNLYLQSFDGTGTAAMRLTDSANAQHPTGLTPDGAHVVFNETSSQQADIRLLTVATRQARSLVETASDERGGVVSRDGWLAYESNRTGRYEVWVQSLSADAGGPVQVTTTGGRQPLFSREGNELFYVAPDGLLMSVAVETKGSSWSNGAQTSVLNKPYYTGGRASVRQYDVMAGGRRFLMMKEEPADADVVLSINVVLNWFEEVRRLVPRR
jgi:Tol biopolymer transport system component